MTLLEIEAFLAVIKYRTISEAAQKLFLSQPALTRRIQILEKELGFPLIVRQKGRRRIELTPEGEDFSKLAWKWKKLWDETNSIQMTHRESLSIGAIDSAMHNTLSELLQEFTKRGYLLKLYNAFSETAYQFMEKGLYDLAFITMQDYTQPLPAGTEVHPAYSEAFVVVSFNKLPDTDGYVYLEDLREELEVYCPWNKEYAFWHDEHFDERKKPIVILEHYMAAQYFLTDDAWMIMPYMTGLHFQKEGAYMYDLKDTPPNQITFYLSVKNNKENAVHHFLDLLSKHLLDFPRDKVQSFLGFPN